VLNVNLGLSSYGYIKIQQSMGQLLVKKKKYDKLMQN